jgi:hypothetical protein
MAPLFGLGRIAVRNLRVVLIAAMTVPVIWQEERASLDAR